METTIILLIVNVFAAVAVIALTLIQQPKGDMGSAFGGGGSQSMFGSRGSANFLTKSTSWMCFVFFASSLTLAYMYAQNDAEDGVVDQSVIEQVNDLPAISGEVQATTDAASSDLPSIPAAEDALDDSPQELESAANRAASELEQESADVTEAVDSAVADDAESEGEQE